jgi:hypothetical protein
MKILLKVPDYNSEMLRYFRRRNNYVKNKSKNKK